MIPVPELMIHDSSGCPGSPWPGLTFRPCSVFTLFRVGNVLGGSAGLTQKAGGVICVILYSVLRTEYFLLRRASVRCTRCTCMMAQFQRLGCLMLIPGLSSDAQILRIKSCCPGVDVVSQGSLFTPLTRVSLPEETRSTPPYIQRNRENAYNT